MEAEPRGVAGIEGAHPTRGLRLGLERTYMSGAIHDDDDGRWDLEMDLRVRSRTPENSFSPALQGRSLGGFVHARTRTGPVDLYLQFDDERTGSGRSRWSRKGECGGWCGSRSR